MNKTKNDIKQNKLQKNLKNYGQNFRMFEQNLRKLIQSCTNQTEVTATILKDFKI